jgi:hypothetical protein
MKQSFPSTQLFPIPILYWLKYPQKSPILLCTRFKGCFLLQSSASWQSASVCLEDSTNPSQQLTWTVFPQGFRDSPHLCGQVLTRDLLGWHYPEATLLQYVVDVLLCGVTEPLICRWLLNFLASRGYKVSKEKAQLCLPQVTCLGMILKGQTCSLSHEQIDPMLHFPLPQTI